FKKDIADMGKSSEAILSLRPVTFHYKSDANAVAQFGLIAEEVEKVDPDLIIRDKEGKPYSVRYEAVNAMLLNEFLKAHKKAQEQEAVIAQLKGELQTVAGQLKEQAAQIREVRARLGNAVPETVAER
ncbi:MAG: tail fiber domain-containing protein, partial [Chthoniobacterales bacterium]|nr:tail fiber domain-containing protein [Chthoniobacterales bacterium]